MIIWLREWWSRLRVQEKVWTILLALFVPLVAALPDPPFANQTASSPPCFSALLKKITPEKSRRESLSRYQS